MHANFIERRACRTTVLALILGGLVLAPPGWLLARASGGQFPQHPSQPSNLPGALPGNPGQPNVLGPETVPNVGIGPSLSRKQKSALVTDNFRRTKQDIAKLSKLVRSLQQAIDKSNANILSLSVIRQANKIEKLAKRIRNEAKEY